MGSIAMSQGAHRTTIPHVTARSLRGRSHRRHRRRNAPSDERHHSCVASHVPAARSHRLTYPSLTPTHTCQPRRGGQGARHRRRRTHHDRRRARRQSHQPQLHKERSRATIRTQTLAKTRRAHRRGTGRAPRCVVTATPGQAGANRVRHRRRRSHVQAPSMPPHRDDGQHLRVLPGRTRLRLRVLNAVVHRVRTHEHARDTREVRPVRTGARQSRPTETPRPFRGQGWFISIFLDLYFYFRTGNWTESCV